MKITAVHISELEGIQYVCAQLELKCVVMEGKYEGIVSVLITNKGNDISPELAWYLRGAAESRQRCFEIERHKISERELMPQKNDVVILVEPLEDLP